MGSWAEYPGHKGEGGLCPCGPSSERCVRDSLPAGVRTSHGLASASLPGTDPFRTLSGGGLRQPSHSQEGRRNLPFTRAPCPFELRPRGLDRGTHVAQYPLGLRFGSNCCTLLARLLPSCATPY